MIFDSSTKLATAVLKALCQELQVLCHAVALDVKKCDHRIDMICLMSLMSIYIYNVEYNIE